jgi:hypothetical protein
MILAASVQTLINFSRPEHNGNLFQA